MKGTICPQEFFDIAAAWCRLGTNVTASLLLLLSYEKDFFLFKVCLATSVVISKQIKEESLNVILLHLVGLCFYQTNQQRALGSNAVN